MRLLLKPGVGDEEKPGLPEGSLDLVSEGSGGEAAGDGRAADVPERDNKIGLHWCWEMNNGCYEER